MAGSAWVMGWRLRRAGVAAGGLDATPHETVLPAARRLAQRVSCEREWVPSYVAWRTEPERRLSADPSRSAPQAMT